jgi:hypothetical protein
MAYELRDNSGSIFKNKRKEKDTHPDMAGEVMIDGVVYWISGWSKESEKAGKWLSLSFKKKDFSEAKEAAAKTTVSDDFESDTIPF